MNGSKNKRVGFIILLGVCCGEQRAVGGGAKRWLHIIWTRLPEPCLPLLPRHLPLLLLLHLSRSLAACRHVWRGSVDVFPPPQTSMQADRKADTPSTVSWHSLSLHSCMSAYILCSPAAAATSFLSITAHNQSLRHWSLLISYTWRTSLFDIYSAFCVVLHWSYYKHKCYCNSFFLSHASLFCCSKTNLKTNAKEETEKTGKIMTASESWVKY